MFTFHIGLITFLGGISCLSASSIDRDGDGYKIGVDCDDDDYTVYPNGEEVLDGIDNDCDGSVDEELDAIPVVDVGLFEEYPDHNFLDEDVRYLGASYSGRERIIVWFDISVVANATIVEAILTIYNSSGTCHSSFDETSCDNTLEVAAHRIDSEWDEGNVCWTLMPLFEEEPDDITTIQEHYGSNSIPFSFVVTEIVADWLHGDRANNGILLKADDVGETTGEEQIDVKIHSHLTELPPKLSVSF